MVQLYDKATGVFLGAVNDDQFQFLRDQLEEESEGDRDYYINGATLELFEQEGADPGLLKLLRGALGTREEMEVQWSRE